MYPCAVSADLRRYEREQDRLAENEARIEAEIEEMADDMLLPGGEFYPYAASMIGEAISECGQDTFDKLHMVAKLLEKSEYEAAGAVMNSFLTAYCKDSAVRQIRRERFL